MMLLSTLMLVLVSLGLTSSREMLYDKYDNVDFDTILGSKRVLSRYISCLLDDISCSPDGRYFRTILPDALETNCKHCTPKLKINIRKVAKHVRKERPADWARFVEKYDPDNKKNRRCTSHVCI